MHKLFARHIKPIEQAEKLSKKNPENTYVLNVYVCTPGRIAKLVEMDACDLKTDRYRYLIVDMSRNKKN